MKFITNLVTAPWAMWQNYRFNSSVQRLNNLTEQAHETFSRVHDKVVGGKLLHVIRDGGETFVVPKKARNKVMRWWKGAENAELFKLVDTISCVATNRLETMKNSLAWRYDSLKERDIEALNNHASRLTSVIHTLKALKKNYKKNGDKCSAEKLKERLVQLEKAVKKMGKLKDKLSPKTPVEQQVDQVQSAIKTPEAPVFASVETTPENSANSLPPEYFETLPEMEEDLVPPPVPPRTDLTGTPPPLPPRDEEIGPKSNEKLATPPPLPFRPEEKAQSIHDQEPPTPPPPPPLTKGATVKGPAATKKAPPAPPAPPPAPPLVQQAMSQGRRLRKVSDEEKKRPEIQEGASLHGATSEALIAGAKKLRSTANTPPPVVKEKKAPEGQRDMFSALSDVLSGAMSARRLNLGEAEEEGLDDWDDFE